MRVASLGTRFMEGTRGQMISLLRRGARTVDELAGALGLTNNAIRNHLATLERDGIVRQEGVRRGPGAGKPAIVYQLDPDAEPLFSNAYAPVLGAVIDVLIKELPAAQADTVMRRVGHQLAAGVGGQAPGTLAARVKAAASVLTALGGEVEILDNGGSLSIRGCSCPLGATVAAHPEVCRAVETLVADVIGVPVRSTCEHGDHPRCCFSVERSLYEAG
jgi:predicted ArsR family transcriptional regulator